MLSINGDGGFLMNSQELETAKRLGIGYTVVVLNDNDYGLVSWKQRLHPGRTVGTALTNPDFVKYASSFGVKAYRPRRREEIRACLKKAVWSNELAVVAIDVDATENDRLSESLSRSSRCARLKLPR